MEHLTSVSREQNTRPSPAVISIESRSVCPRVSRRDERMMSDIFESCDVAMSVINLDRIIQFANPAFRKLGRNCPTLTNASRVAASLQPESQTLKNAIESTFDDGRPRTEIMPSTNGPCGMTVLISMLSNSPCILLTIIPFQDNKLDGSKLCEVLRTKWSLSRRESECAILLSQGKPAKRIAEERGVSLPTIRTQLQAIREKLGVESSLEAAAMINCATRP